MQHEFELNSLPNDAILDSSKLKAFADDKTKCFTNQETFSLKW